MLNHCFVHLTLILYVNYILGKNKNKSIKKKEEHFQNERQSAYCSLWLVCVHIYKHFWLSKEVLRKHCSKLYIDITEILELFFLNPSWHHWTKFEF